MSGKYYHPARTEETRAVITRAILANPNITTTELSQTVGIGSKTNIMYHIKRLEAAGIIHWQGKARNKNKASSERQKAREANGAVQLPKLTPARQEELIAQVVRKAQGSGRNGEQDPGDDVVRYVRGPLFKSWRLRGCKF